ncbi:MAG: hypothetical protein AAF725_03355 [Acidobacteriota bacterium]
MQFKRPMFSRRDPRFSTLLRLCIGCVLISLGGTAGAQQGAKQTVKNADAIESWLYIEPYEVRFEALVPFTLLESLMPIPRSDESVLTIAEQEAAADTILLLFQAQTSVIIDGISVQPYETKLVFFDETITSITQDPVPSDLETRIVTVGLIYRYSLKGPAHQVSLEWMAFNPIVERVLATVFAGEYSRREVLVPFSSQVKWTSASGPLQGPEISASFLEVRDKTPREERTAEVTEALLRNIYRAFDYRLEEEIYDALAGSVTGDLLAEVYLDIRQGLAIQAEGGASARVHRVDLRDGSLQSTFGRDKGFLYTASWTVWGRVEHWGHIHERQNIYTADFTVVPVGSTWRFSAMKVRQQERVDSALSVRSAPAPEGFR